ncbi:MAG: EscU/YscU/HrcU family type III secretion system export apparatus switch protein [Armatimonadetes bacterium]|nr:EscU/YscU/HrcU family type III secretion system export apparatus switch protein [Armatimonadota bacterium]MCX7969626.1 EscU/YscU/HrcU family type III secretion system export apparatus switch protein [Armatimonadota bacterium]MDW8142918.1 EscU/YscU/HrcU family type III secretion system export apparatus switch protein [Armatimonadota bacterium]
MGMFWSDKTEAPTPRRREEARKQGLVPRSAELTGTLVLLAGAVLGLLLFPSWLRSLNAAMSALLVNGDWTPLAKDVLVKPLLFIASLMLVAFLVGAIQTRFLFTLYPLRFDWQKVNPVSGFKRMFSVMTFWDGLRAVLKAALVGYVGFVTVRAGWNAVLATSTMDVQTGTNTLGSVGLSLLWRCAIVLLVLSAIDYAIQWWRVERNLRMTRQEVKDELKQTEGDPNVKAQLRRRYRQLVMHRQIQRVKEATVVVTNPTHYAVALRYDPKTLPAPQVIAKGSDWMAKRIVQEAQKHGVPIVQNAPLAQALMKVNIGAFIPPELYQAAAEVLAYVFRITGRAKEVLGEA